MSHPGWCGLTTGPPPKLVPGRRVAPITWFSLCRNAGPAAAEAFFSNYCPVRHDCAKGCPTASLPRVAQICSWVICAIDTPEFLDYSKWPQGGFNEKARVGS